MYLIRIKIIKFLVDKYQININYKLLRSMYLQAKFTYATTKDPFCLQYSKSRFYDILLFKILKRFSLHHVFFKLIKIFEYFYYLITFFKKCFFDTNAKYWQYNLLQIKPNNFYRVLTITKGIERAFSPLLKTKKSFLDLPVFFSKLKNQKISKLLIIKTAIKFQYFSFWHIKQYLILKITMPKIKFKYLVLEEGLDYISNLIYSLYSIGADKTILTHSFPYFYGFTKNDFDVNLVYDKMSYRDSISVKNKTLLRKRKKINSIRKSSQPRVLYFTTTESETLPKKLKQTIDIIIINLLVKNNLDFLVSFHPQDIKRGYDKYIIDHSQIKNSNIRKEKDLRQFIGKNDIVISHFSGVLTYAHDIGAKLVILNNNVVTFKKLFSKIYYPAIFVKYDDIKNNTSILNKFYEKK